MKVNSAIRSVLRRMRSEATAALICNGDLRAIGVIQFMDSLVDEEGSVSEDAVLIANEVLDEC